MQHGWMNLYGKVFDFYHMQYDILIVNKRIDITIKLSWKHELKQWESEDLKMTINLGTAIIVNTYFVLTRYQTVLSVFHKSMR